jgi:hypothetical protein
MHIEISSDTYHSVNTDDNHNACDTSGEDPRPAKRRKPRSARAVTPPLHLRRPPLPPPTTRAEIDEAQSQDDHRCSSTFIDEQNCASRTSRSPSAASEAVPVAEYQEWPFQGFLKRIRIGDDVTYNLEFKLPLITEQLPLPIDPKALDIFPSKGALAKVPTYHDAAAHSKIHQAPLQPEKKRKHVKWTSEEDATLLKMKDEDGCSWEEIAKALPHHIPRTIQPHYYAIRAGIGEVDVSGGQQQKRRRGRPRKQT